MAGRLATCPCYDHRVQTVGYVLVIVAIAVALLLEPRVQRMLDKTPGADKLGWFLVPIVLGLGAHFIAKRMGYLDLGLWLAIGLIGANGIAHTLTEWHLGRGAGFDREAATRFKRLVLAQGLARVALWAGVVLALFGPR